MRRFLIAALCMLIVVPPALAGQRSRSGYSRSYSSRSYSAPSRSYSRPYSTPSYRSTYRAPRSTYRAPTRNTYRPSRAATPRPSTRISRAPKYGTPELKRDPAQRAAFQRSRPCPSTGKTSGACPGYVVDHIRPLAKGGADHPSNMQWQTVESAKVKDKWERK